MQSRKRKASVGSGGDLRYGLKSYQRGAKRARYEGPVAVVSVPRAFFPQSSARPELKFFDTSIVDATVANTMSFYNLTVVPQGDTESGRTGRKIVIKKIQLIMEAILTPQTTANTTSCNLRVLCVLDTQTNGSQFAATDLLESDSIISFNNLANSSRFRVLKSKIFSFSAQGAAPTGAAYTYGEITKFIKWNMNCSIPIEYDNSASTGVITSVRSNNVYICLQTSTAEVIAVGGTARIRYIDN